MKTGLRQQIKSGQITPTEALNKVLNSEYCSEKFVEWVRTTGKRRYAERIKSVSNETTAKPTEK